MNKKIKLSKANSLNYIKKKINYKLIPEYIFFTKKKLQKK